MSDNLTWIKHDGGPMPVPGDTLIASKFRHGGYICGPDNPQRADRHAWSEMGTGTLAEYAIVAPSPSESASVTAIDAHYTKYAIQPMEFSLANGLDPAQHTVIKYVVRYRDKGGERDLRAAIRVLELMIARGARS